MGRYFVLFMNNIVKNEEYGYIFDDVDENIRINEYLFFKDGNIASITHYTKTGKTDLKFMGKIYEVN